MSHNRPSFAKESYGSAPNPARGQGSPVAGYDFPQSPLYDVTLPATSQSAGYAMPTPPLQSEIISAPLGSSSLSPPATRTSSFQQATSAYPVRMDSLTSSAKAAAPVPVAAAGVDIATVGVDATHDGRVDYYVRGVDSTHDGIPDVLEQQAPAYAAVAAYPQAVESVSPHQVPVMPVPVSSRLPGSAESVSYVEHHQVYTRPPTVEKVGYHIEKQQVTDYVTVREVVEKQVPVGHHEVDRLVEDVHVVPAQAVEYVSAAPVVKAPPPQAVEYVSAAPVVKAPPPKAVTVPARVLQPAPAVETVQAKVLATPPPQPPPQPVMVRTAPAVERVASAPRPAPVVQKRAEAPVTVPLSVVSVPQSAPVRKEIFAPPPVMRAPPMAPTPAPVARSAPMTLNMKPVIPFLAEFVGTFILVFSAGLASMYGVGMEGRVVESPATRLAAPAADALPRPLPGVDVASTYTAPVAAGGYCRRCDGTLAKLNGTLTSEESEGVSALQLVKMSAKTLKLQSTLQKILTWAASTTCWCSSAYFAPLFGMAVLLIIYAVLLFFVRPMSGAHMNPAISLAAFLSGKLNLMAMLIYWCAQVLGALLAALLFALLVGFDCMGVAPRDGYSWWQAAVVEFIYTGLLAFTFLSVHPAHKGNGKENKYNIFLYPFTLMSAFGAGIAAAAHISGAFLNPATSIAFEIMNLLLTSRGSELYWLLYVIMQLLGAVLAAVVFYICRPDERMHYRSATEERFSFFPLSTKLACEFVGTWIFTFTIACAYWGGLNIECLAGALCLIAIYTAMCMVSGGHFNPAVTLSVMLSERHILSGAVRDGLWYMLIQIVAASLAAFECAAVHRGRTFEARSLDWSWFVWGLVEALLTCIVVLAFLACTRTRDEVVVTHLRYQIALALAFCFGVAGLVLNYFVLPGSFLNPAMALGLADAAQLLTGGTWYMGLVVAFFDFLGGLVAYGVFTGFRELSHKPTHYGRA
mmetsp:Transcript_78478/g.143515  ORF Transcript_78478/g.143515 Transcript_78478/m.143515 type:complete len:972 (+) Transcript_78478:184-3099(+)